MNKSRRFLLLMTLMVISTLVVATISTGYLYLELDDVANINHQQATYKDINEMLLIAGAIALVSAILVISIACSIYFRITHPHAQKIEQQAETFHTLVKNAHEAIFLIDTHGNIEFMNKSAEKMFGYSTDELTGRNIKNLMPPPHRDRHDSYIQDYLQTGVKKIIGKSQQRIALRKDGSQFPIYLSVEEIHVKHAHLFAGLIVDLSTQQRLQKEILAIPAREQQRIGEELHDGLGQQLTGLSMLAESLLNKASKPEYELAEQLASGLNEALKQVRAVSRGLMPLQIFADGFVISLQEITESIQQQSNIPIRLNIDDVVLLFDDAVATHLYRIVQESLNNAIKHANASQIEVTLKIEDDHGLLEISDDGIGIIENPEDSGGLGLNIMKHRCGLFDGEITINPAGKCGTQVRCRFPVNPPENEIID